MVNEGYTLTPLLCQLCRGCYLTFIALKQQSFKGRTVALTEKSDLISKCILHKESVNYFQAGLSDLVVQRTAAPTAFSFRDLHKQHSLSELIAVTLGQISQSYYYPV